MVEVGAFQWIYSSELHIRLVCLSLDLGEP